VQGRRELLRQRTEPFRDGFDDGGRRDGVDGLRYRLGGQQRLQRHDQPGDVNDDPMGVHLPLD
jgi:hypothetical protein